MQDDYFQLGSVTDEEEEVSRAVPKGFRPIEFDNLNQFGVTYEVNLDMTSYQRTVYSFLEWLSDLGGLSSALVIVQGVILKILMYQALDYFMVSQLYNRRKLDPGENKVVDESTSKDVESISGEDEKLDLK